MVPIRLSYRRLFENGYLAMALDARARGSASAVVSGRVAFRSREPTLANHEKPT